MARAWTDWLPDVLPVAVALLRRSDGTVAHANRAFTELLAVDDAVGQYLDDLVRHEGAFETVVEAADAGGVTDLTGSGSGGMPLVLEATATTLDGDGEPQILLVLTDVTERRDLAAAVADMARFPDMNPGPVLRLDRDGIVLRTNPAARTLFGADDVVGRSWVDRCAGMTAELWSAIVEGRQDRLVMEVAIDDAVLQFTHLRADDGESVFAFGADITGRHAAEQQLAEQAKQLAEMARFPDMNPGPVLRMDLEGKVLLANRAAQDLFGTDVFGGDWRALYPEASRHWQTILGATEPVHVEARLDDHEYVFAHRMDAHSGLVFVYGYDVTAQRNAERALRQSEKMATLGTLVAGVAHELNNPAAATRRAAHQLREALAAWQQAQRRLAAAGPSSATPSTARLEATALQHAAAPGALDAIARADLEADIEDWLDERGVVDIDDLAPALVDQGFTPGSLDAVADGLDGALIEPLLAWSAAAYRTYRLAHEIGTGSERISEIVRALKSYSYLGQAPQQAVDLHAGLDDTLVILRHKLKRGIEVRREYATDLPNIPAYGSELNQVWTNLIDNAADAMGGMGVLTIRTRRDGPWATVEVIDDGPGIPPKQVTRIFDPFFTTKPPGAGTGLGLSTSFAIVTDKHRGELSVASHPGETRFTVRLPLQPADVNR